MVLQPGVRPPQPQPLPQGEQLGPNGRDYSLSGCTLMASAIIVL